MYVFITLVALTDRGTAGHNSYAYLIKDYPTTHWTYLFKTTPTCESHNFITHIYCIYEELIDQAFFRLTSVQINNQQVEERSQRQLEDYSRTTRRYDFLR